MVSYTSVKQQYQEQVCRGNAPWTCRDVMRLFSWDCHRILSGCFWLAIALAFLQVISGIAIVQGADAGFAAGTTVPLNPQYQSGDPAVTFYYTLGGDLVVFQNLENSKDSRYPVGLYAYHISENRTELVPGTAMDDEHGANILGTRVQKDRIVWQRMFSENVFHIYNTTTGTERVVPDSSAWGALRSYHRTFGNITIDTVERTEPAVDWDRIVWSQGFSTATNDQGTDLFMMNMTTGEVIPITESPGGQVRPSISGRYIVWEDTRNGIENPDIYLYDLETRTETPVCTDPSYQRYPVVSGDYVIWLDFRNGFDFSQIRMYQISTGTESVIGGDQIMRHDSPFISGDRVVFLKCIPYSVNPRGICQAILYDIGTNEYSSLPKTEGSQSLWGFSGDRILYSEETDTSRQMYLFTLENRTPALPAATVSGESQNSSSVLPADTPVTGVTTAAQSPGFGLLPCSIAVFLACLVLGYRRKG